MVTSFAADAIPGVITCVQAAYDFAPIATVRQVLAKKQQSAYGSVIYSLKDNPEIQSIPDLVRKRVGVAQPLASGSFQLGWQVLLITFNIF